jgi:glycine oxidase
MPETTADVVVIGAGAIGGAVAFHLAKAGRRVVLLEREGIASGASTHATGSFSLLGADFPTEPALQLGLASYRLSRDLIGELEELSGVDTLYQLRPGLRVALDEEEEAYIREREDWQQIIPFTWIDGDAVRRIEPRLSPRIRGAAYEEEAAQVDSGRFTLALVSAAERLGATLLLRRVTGLERSGGRVTGVRHTGGTIVCEHVVLAMGPWAAVASKWLDFPVPIRPLWGERILLQLAGEPLAAIVNSPKRGHLIWRRDGFLSAGSTAGRDFDDQRQYLADLPEDEAFVARPTEAALLEIMQRAIDVLPVAEDATVVQQLAGYRPLSPDRLPLIGPVPGLSGAFLATGHGTKGIHLAVATGKIVADLITRGSTDLEVPLAAFDPARFGGGEAQGGAVVAAPMTMVED